MVIILMRFRIPLEMIPRKQFSDSILIKLLPMKINFKAYHYQKKKKIESLEIQVNDQILSQNNSLKMLRVTLYDKLNFNDHICNICKTTYGQINALKRISCFLNTECRFDVYKSFINADFNCCPLVWMFCGKKLEENRKITGKGSY